jgi:predicted DNA-binding transcriptional regulator AlpA
LPANFRLTFFPQSWIIIHDMTEYSSAEAAKKLGISSSGLNKHIKLKKIPAPRVVQVGRLRVQAWNDEEIERVRQLLPKIANGRKTRHKKKQPAGSAQRLAKPKQRTRKKKQ